MKFDGFDVQQRFEYVAGFMATSPFVPEEFRRTPDFNAPWMRILRHYLPRVLTEGRILVKCGSFGQGKSYTSYFAALCGNFTWHQLPVYHSKAVSRWPIDDKPRFEASYQHTELVVLDDLGTEHDSAWNSGNRDEWFDWRYMRRLPTIVTTNLGKAEFDTFVGPRIASRINGWGWRVELGYDKAPDRRKIEAPVPPPAPQITPVEVELTEEETALRDRAMQIQSETQCGVARAFQRARLELAPEKRTEGQDGPEGATADE